MASLQEKKILIVDDEKSIRDLVVKALSLDGAEVFSAESVDVGMEIAKLRMPHLMITDLSMPGKTGFDLLREKSQSEILKKTPIIVLSGLSDRKSVTEAIALGANDYVLKPIKASALLQKVKTQLNSKSLLSQIFSVEARPKATLSIIAKVVAINEAGMQIESAVKLAASENLAIEGEFLEKIGCNRILARTARAGCGFMAHGCYCTELHFVGIGPDIAKTIRARLKDWK